MPHKSIPLSPLRYPGAKRWMAAYIAKAISYNRLSIDLFVEPFAGGASVSIALLSRNLVKSIGINERDPLLASFWYTVFFDTDWLLDSIQKVEVNLNQWEKYKNSHSLSIRQKAFKCLYLNRTSFSGILKNNAGPIGGKSQSSKYKINCRFNKETLIKRIIAISAFRDKVAFVWNFDWEMAVKATISLQELAPQPLSTLFYFDPPFYNRGATLYRYYFDEDDHLNLRVYLNKLKQPWILSYDMCPEIMSLYKNSRFSASGVNLIYTTRNFGKRQLGKEVIFSNLPIMVSELQLGADKRVSNLKRLEGTTDGYDNFIDVSATYDRIKTNSVN